MMRVFSCAFFGHRDFRASLQSEKDLEKIIKRLIDGHEYVEFLVGRNGAFDLFVSSVILRVKREYYDKNSALILVLPYLTAEFQNNEKEYYDYYDEIEICEKASQAHYRTAIQIRNREMVDRADLIVCFIERRRGGAYEAVRYAERNRKEIIKLKDGLDI